MKLVTKPNKPLFKQASNYGLNGITKFPDPIPSYKYQGNKTRKQIQRLTGLHELKSCRIVLLEGLVEPGLGEVLERIGGVFAGATAVLHSPGVVPGTSVLGLAAASRLVTLRRLFTRPRAAHAVAPPLLLLLFAVLLVEPCLLGSLLAEGDHVDLAALPAFYSQHRAGIACDGWILIDTQELVCWVDDVHAQPMMSMFPSPSFSPTRTGR